MGRKESNQTKKKQTVYFAEACENALGYLLFDKLHIMFDL